MPPAAIELQLLIHQFAKVVTAIVPLLAEDLCPQPSSYAVSHVSTVIRSK